MKTKGRKRRRRMKRRGKEKQTERELRWVRGGGQGSLHEREKIIKKIRDFGKK